MEENSDGGKPKREAKQYKDDGMNRKAKRAKRNERNPDGGDGDDLDALDSR